MTKNQTRYEQESLKLEHRKLWVSLIKHIVTIVVIGLLSLLLENSFKTKQLLMQELEMMGRFISTAIDDNAAVRMRFAQYFAVVSSDKKARERWNDYYQIVEAEYRMHQDSLRVLDKKVKTIYQELDSLAQALKQEKLANVRLNTQIAQKKSELIAAQNRMAQHEKEVTIPPRADVTDKYLLIIKTTKSHFEDVRKIRSQLPPMIQMQIQIVERLPMTEIADTPILFYSSGTLLEMAQQIRSFIGWEDEVALRFNNAIQSQFELVIP